MRALPTGLRLLSALVAAGVVCVGLGGCTEENHQPTLDPIPSQTVRVGATLELVVTGRDPDGDPLSFNATPRPLTARWEGPEHNVFVWPPLISDTGPTGKTHDVLFTVEDGRGGIASRKVQITVLPQSNAPTFIGPTGYVLNLSEDDDISFIVSVKDDDSADVELEMKGEMCSQGCRPGYECKSNGYCAIEGADFTRLDGKTAAFHWRPSVDQLEIGNYWQLVIGGKDESHEEVFRQLSILLMNGDSEKSCPGSPPVIVPCDDPACVPLPDLKGVGAVVFQAQGVDVESEIREMTLHWATNNPLDAASYLGNELTLERCDPTEDAGCPEDTKDRYFIGTLPHPAPASTEALLLHYYVTAVDNDDIQGTGCDHVARMPKAGHFTMVVSPSGSQGCKEDGKEPNDTVELAAVLEAGPTYDLRSCAGAGHEDWYLVDVQPGAIVSFELLHDDDHGPLAVSVHDGLGTQLFPPLGAPAVDHLVYTPSASPLYVRVAAPDTKAAKNQTYGLVVTRTFGGCPDESTFEPIDDTIDGAVYVGSSTREVVVCPGDRDWLKVPVEPGFSLVLDLDFQHAFGDLDMRLYTSGGEVLARSETATSDEQIVFHSQQEDTFYIELLGYHSAHNSGVLDIQVVQTAKLCFEDKLSPNHVPATAKLLPENVYYDLLICPDKEDWFRLDMNTGEQLTVIAQPYIPQDAVLDLVVFSDEEGKIIVGQEQATNTPNQVRWSAVAEEPGSLRWRIRTLGEFTAIYDMAFGVSDPPGECQDDRFSPTNTVKAALDVDKDAGFVTRLKICPGGEDWFRIQGAAFEELFVYVFGFPSEEPLTADLHRFEGTDLVLVEHGKQTSNGVEILHMPQKNTEFYINVRGAPGAVHHYDLVIGSQ